MTSDLTDLRSAFSPADEDEDGPGLLRRMNRRARTALVVGMLVVLAVAITWVVAFSSVFGVRTVDVHGEQNLTSAQVERAADIGTGTPLVRLDVAAITRRIERLPDVASAQVSTSFPSTVVITVAERTPVGYVRRGGADVLVDRTGLQYRTVPDAPSRLPQLVVPRGTDARTTGGAVATVAASLPRALLHKVISIQALDPRAITLVLTKDRIVQWGSAARSRDKARLLPVLLRPRDTVYNLSDPDQPFSH